MSRLLEPQVRGHDLGGALLMCGVSIEVLDAYKELDELNRESSFAFWNWSQTPMAQRRYQFKAWL
eukprot:11173759-Lingulodinium_polyedra.AAC.1